MSPAKSTVLPRALSVLVLLGAACDEAQVRGVDPVDALEPRDLEPVDGGKFDGAFAAFDPTLLFDDATFTDADAVTAEAIQGLLESTPYGSRSFLADETIGGVPVSKVLVDVAAAKQINPIVLLVRLQVEQSLVSKTQRPTGKKAVDFAMGCGCADGKSCAEAFRGLDKQLACAATTLRTHYDGSLAGTGAWRVGLAKATLDPQTVTPRSHATASLYAYTPWVLEDEGGNWLAWNVGRKYMGALIDRGAWQVDAEPEPSPTPVGSCVDHCGTSGAIALGDGQACFCDDACGANGDCCGDFAEVCGAPGDGPDGAPEPGDAPPPNEPGDAPGDEPGDAPGDAPTDDPGDAPSGGSCVDACDSTDPVAGTDGTQCYCDDFCVTNGDCCTDRAQACG